MHEVVVHEEADNELKEAAALYESRREGLGDSFLQAIEEGFRSIQSFPLSGTILYDVIRKRPLARRFPYSIVYRVEADQVLVLAVAHAHRRPFYWRERG